MKDKLRRIDPLIKRAEERKDAAAREFAAKTRLLATHEQRLGDLIRYSEEYAQMPIGGSLAPAQLANREAFRAKLTDAVVLQKQQVDHARSMTEIERVRLTLASREQKVVEKLAENYRFEQIRIEEHYAQKSMDDFAVGAFQRRRQPQEDTP